MAEFFICLFCFLCGGFLRAQTDTAFWFAAPDINANHNERPIDLKRMGMVEVVFVISVEPVIPRFRATGGVC